MYMVYFLRVFGSSYNFFIYLTRSERLVLMTYYGAILSLSGYQADEVKILAQYKAVVDRYVSFIRFRFLTEFFIGLKHAILQARYGFSIE